MTETGIVRRLYDWVLHWAYTPYGTLALFLLAFTESSFFPVPPDVLLIALALGMPQRAFRFAAICTIGSVLGGMLGYYIGLTFFDIVGYRILEFYGFMDKFEMVKAMYNRYDVWFVGVAGFTPIPYKVFTIAAGTFHMNFVSFVTVSALSRGARFFIVSTLIWKFGKPIKAIIDKYFNLLTILFIILLVLGFIIIKYLF
ncbi:MAG: DedA family protein [Candidatus Latescibacteria bacterium]|nr:DedA family protein [Candidatus Latescibacterota bacterium]